MSGPRLSDGSIVPAWPSRPHLAALQWRHQSCTHGKTDDLRQLMSDRPMSLDEALFRVWIESVKDFAIFMVNPDGTVASWNVGAERILGYSEPEILGQSFARIFTPEDQGRVSRARNPPGRDDGAWLG